MWNDSWSSGGVRVVLIQFVPTAGSMRALVLSLAGFMVGGVLRVDVVSFLGCEIGSCSDWV